MAELRAYLRVSAAWCCCAAVAIVGGCRNLDNAQVDVLERELRQQEDYIYELEDYLIEYSEKLRQARVAECPPSTTPKTSLPAASKGRLPDPTIDEDLPRRSLPINGRNKVVPLTEAPPASALTAPSNIQAPTTTGESPTSPPASEPPAAEAPATAPPAESEEVPLEELEAPKLEVGPVGSLQQRPGDQVATTREPPSESNDAGPLLIPDPVDYQSDGDTVAAVAAPSAGEVQDAGNVQEPQLAAPQVNAPRLSAQQLEIRRVFSEPSKTDESQRSLLVIVEAVNATNEPVEAIGAASLMIMARDATGALSRIERWDFTAEETAAAWQSSHLGDGLHLELPLENGELPEGDLELWARVVADDGAKLLTSAEAPYRFEATKLASMADATSESELAASQAPEAEAPTDGPAEASTLTAAAIDQSKTPAKAAELAKPTWRASSVQLDENRVEGFAASAGAKPAGWSTTDAGTNPRMASASAKNDAPTWKRSTRAAAAAEQRPEWSANR